MGMQKALVAIALVAGTARADDQTLLHAELDPLTFANQPGYGGQIGVRHPALHGVRIAIASFALHVPDVLSGLLGNDGVDQRVRPSGAIYGLYYVGPPGKDGLAIGASLRYLRIRYELESDPAMRIDVSELSPEVIAGYQWHPLDGRFYVQPWFALGVTVWRSRGLGFAYEPPVSPFFTVNVGYELAL